MFLILYFQKYLLGGYKMFNEISLVDLTKEGPNFDKFDALRKMAVK